jgi:UDP-glucose 4-epimerase
MSELPSIDWTDCFSDGFADRRVLVTGGAGFIGSHLAEALSGLGARVVVIDDLSGGTTSNLQPLNNVDFVEGSILDSTLLRQCTTECELVFHLAALGSVPRSVAEPGLFHEVNTTGTLNVLKTARESRTVRRVIFSASSSAYGGNPVPWIETMPTLACSPYAATKVAGEAMLQAYASAYGLDTVSLRYFNIFGPRQNANSAYAAVIAAFAKALHAGRRPIIFGDGEQSRDFTYVANVVYANLLAAGKADPLGGIVINVGCGDRISVNALARQMSDAFGRPDLRPIYEPERAGDLKHSFADLQRAQSLLGYVPRVSFATGLATTVAWYRKTLL